MMLDHIHTRAICDEIGERLREILDRESQEIPPGLARLVDALVQLDHGPSIAPSIEEMSFPPCPKPLDLVKRSADGARPATNRGLIFVGP
jgi:hypothetical protein